MHFTSIKHKALAETESEFAQVAAVAVDVAAAVVVDLFETFAAAAALLLRSISASAFAFTFITSNSMTRSLLWSKAKLEARQHGTWSWLLQCLLSFSSTHSHTYTHTGHTTKQNTDKRQQTDALCPPLAGTFQCQLRLKVIQLPDGGSCHCTYTGRT